ncbi:hypothetical protein [Streptomyces brasiliensis]|uniref:Uncharacterized protein n=1 Tax=Streptomyces brasiliensis TaxID=1954 RepID=A0A917NTU9_9ACTN|nr:hypothetical protein [Streptomyces brasiliensis]GGJ29471.1 hypothetical protein GCM10010121_045980 [Streptomyces brasiliensis]
MVTKSVWLVGFPFRSHQGRPVQHFYLVHEAPDAQVALEAALHRARTPGERALRGGLDIEEATAEIREVVCGELGIWHMAERAPLAEGPTAVPTAMRSRRYSA